MSTTVIGTSVDPYSGREHSEAKHHILKTYLQRLLMIVGQKFDRIAFIDCFAGPWQSQSDDLSDTSPGIALRTMRDCQVTLRENHNRSVAMRALFIEENPECCRALSAFLLTDAANGIETAVWNQTFQDAVGEITRWARPGEFAFVFVDPWGWKDVIEPATLAPLLKRPKTELLINFMTNFIGMATGHENQKRNLTKLFGPEYEGLNADGRVGQYRRMLREAGGIEREGRLRTASLPIEHANKRSTFFHMVYATRNPIGLLTFLERAENTDKHQREQKQRRVNSIIGQQELFGEHRASARPADVSKAEAAWLSAFPELGVPVEFSPDVMADVAEQADCQLSELQRIGLNLIRQNILDNVSAPAAKKRRTVNAVHWKSKERMVRLK